MWFPYKSYLSTQNTNNLGLQYKLNNGPNQNIENITNAVVDDIKVCEVSLSGLNFGSNTISFSVPDGKENPMIGNMYITISNSEEEKNKVYDSIFASEKGLTNPNAISVNFVKGYGLSTIPEGTYQTNFTKRSAAIDDVGEIKDEYLLGYLGNVTTHNGPHDEKYYTFYINVPVSGRYEISGIFNSGESRGLTFWKNGLRNNNEQAKFVNLRAADWNKLKSFDKDNKAMNGSSSLQLDKGLNKLIVTGQEQNSVAPNLGNVTFKLQSYN
ncbi:hypothetical protein [Mycoplasma bradburyae]|uniref:Haemagglutinin Mycoplasma domain-containing protein n=1 Tax=Mycoplasma bradburyae TaxID=2963128 RepID=A0ABT5GB26_9MOLU|nr:hypothetical protein [Mycoplasma bradburyae]MDC4182098.1 hypothetical protein [Mycoplasma bradburyae]UTS69828.1 hypothetical protein NMG68_02260 [Mycoplasma bradburyae]